MNELMRACAHYPYAYGFFEIDYYLYIPFVHHAFDGQTTTFGAATF